MSKISQCRALLLVAIVPAVLVAGCGASSSTQAMKGEASPATPTDTGSISPEETGMESPTSTAGAGKAQAAVQNFFNAMKSGNVDQIVGTFSNDAVVAWAGQPTAEGTAAIRKLFQDKAKSMAQATNTIDESKELGTEDAVVRATSKTADKNFRELFLLSQAGGEWKISQFMNNQSS
ncbi:nuclear transport factor 2 family protein [Nonomuraea sp. NPDC046802]|uniref:YybH family protein n=1 Tax=Nonomuraea sp. NPDC046802 TaxID=3154919 RepID=UPI0033DBD028